MNRTVMLVDDSSFMRQLERNTLEDTGYDIVAEASDGEQAISYYELYKPEITLMDITMHGLSGVETLQHIMKNYPEAKIIMCSSMGQEYFIKEAITSGAKDFIVKPFTREALLRTFSAVLSI